MLCARICYPSIRGTGVLSEGSLRDNDLILALYPLVLHRSGKIRDGQRMGVWHRSVCALVQRGRRGILISN